MDTARFDALVRVLGRSSSRRAGLRALAAAVLAPVAARARPAAAEICANDDQCCHCRTYWPDAPGQCIYREGQYIGCCLATDTICGEVCCPPNQPCIPPISGDPYYSRGACCQPDSNGNPTTRCGDRYCCGPNTTCCGGGPQCCDDSIQDCVLGQCMSRCPDGAIRCGTACCPSGQVCADAATGQCASVCPDPPNRPCGRGCCVGNQRCQDGSCVEGVLCDPATKVQCNDRCCKLQGETCCFGSGPGSTCCPTTQRCCTGSRGAACCDRDSHCCDGMCCTGIQVCDGGTCLDECRNGQHRCGKVCCPAGTVCESVGTGGGAVCAPCPAGQADCGGRCKNLKSDEENCGSCGKQCRKKQTCRKGRCVRKR